MKPYVRLLAFFLFFTMLLPLVSCGGTGDDTPQTSPAPETIEQIEVLPGFDYSTVDLSQYVSFGEFDPFGMALSLAAVPEITDEAVKTEFSSYFNQTGSVYYPPVADTGRAVAEGDTVYMYYTGITVTALEKAVSDGLLPDTQATGMTYPEILALGLGFSGGTTSRATGLKIGSHSYIDGFESGLIGYVPKERGESDPVRLSLTFPQNYQEQSLRGQPVIFFCQLLYIGDEAAGPYTADTISVEMVNALLGLTGEQAYKSMEDCMQRVREGLDAKRSWQLFQAQSAAVYEKLSAQAIIPTVPDEITEACVRAALSQYLYDLIDMYNNYPDYYAAQFGTAVPTERLIANYLGYTDEDYMTPMKQTVLPSVKGDMIFWYFVQQENITLTEQEIEARMATYTAQYGANFFDGIELSLIKEQFLRDKFAEEMIREIEQRGNLTYTQTQA